MSAHTQLRQPAGSPDGGEYAPQTGAESNLRLGLRLGGPGASPGELLAECHRQVSLAFAKLARNRGPSFEAERSDDLAQEVALRVLADQGRVSIRIDEGAYIHGIALNTIRESLRGQTRRADYEASGVLYAEIESLEAALRRRITSSEFKHLVDSIRGNWDTSDGHGRPSKDFYEFAREDTRLDIEKMESITKPRSLQSLSAEDESLIFDPSAHQGTYLGIAEKNLTAGGRKGHAGARAAAWNMMAERDSAPLAVRASLAKNAVTAARSHVGTHDGGVRGVIDQWERGEDTPATEALFAPFGCIDDTGKRAIVNTLKHSSYCEELWDSALVFASTRFQFDDKVEEARP